MQHAQRGVRKIALTHRLARLLLWALVVGVPFVVLPTAQDPFRLPKLLAAETLGLASLLLLAFGLLRAGRLTPPRRLPVVQAVAPLALVATAGLLVTAYPHATREALASLWIGLACLVGWSLALSAKELSRFLFGLLVPASALGALAVAQATGLFQPFGFVQAVRGRMEVVSLAGNPGDLAGFLALGALVAQWGLLRADRWRPAWWLALGALLLAVAGIGVSQTLGGVGALIFGSGLLWALALPRRRFALGAGVALALVLVLLAAFEPLRGRAVAAAGQLARGEVNAFLTGRLDGWRAAGWMMRERPVLGVGHGAYLSEFSGAKLELLERGMKPFPGQPFPVFANAHNELLEVAAEWGLLGLLALGWGGWILGRRAARIGRGGEAAAGADRAFAWAALAALALLAAVHFPFRLAITAYPALLLLAWIFRRAEEADD